MQKICTLLDAGRITICFIRRFELRAVLSCKCLHLQRGITEFVNLGDTSLHQHVSRTLYPALQDAIKGAYTDAGQEIPDPLPMASLEEMGQCVPIAWNQLVTMDKLMCGIRGSMLEYYNPDDPIQRDEAVANVRSTWVPMS